MRGREVGSLIMILPFGADVVLAFLVDRKED
jgi:hypothetical protein